MKQGRHKVEKTTPRIPSETEPRDATFSVDENEPSEFGDSNDSDEALRLQLLHSLDALQTLAPDHGPGLEQFRQLVIETKLHEQKRGRRDVLTFLGVAVLVMTLWAFCMTYSPRAFITLLIVIFVLSALVLPVGYVVQHFREETS